MRNTGATGQPVSYQTVKLARGKHASSDDGVCVMELASMLAGEDFSDHPLSVCPVIGAFLRAYNDRLDDRWRQNLYVYAAKIVGTRGTIEVELRRAQMCSEWLRRMKGRNTPPEKLPSVSSQPGRLRRWLQNYRHRPEYVAHRAAIQFGRAELDYAGHKLDYEMHRAALRFVDELIAVGRREDPLFAEPKPAAIESLPASSVGEVPT